MSEGIWSETGERREEREERETLQRKREEPLCMPMKEGDE